MLIICPNLCGDIMTKLLSVLFLISCSSDISVITVEKNQEDNDTADTSEEVIIQSDDMTDLTIGYAKIHFKQIACPACVGASGEFDITSSLKLHYPTSGDYFEYMQPVGSCTTNLTETHVSSQPLPATQIASFNNIQLTPVGEGEWSNNYMYEHQYQRQTSHNVMSENGNVINAFQTLEGFDYIEPYTLLWVDPSYAFEAVVSKNGTTFSWSPVVSNSQFEIIIAIYSPDGSQFLGAVSCMQNDVGYMNIPGTYIQQYPFWSLAAVHLIRHQIEDKRAIELNGHLQSHMVWEVIGTAHIE